MARIPKLGRVVRRTRHTTENDMWYVAVRWVDDDGTLVQGVFKLVGWHATPADFGRKIDKILSKPPRAVYRRQRPVNTQ